ncbi:MAG: hypothetical protein WB780_20555 [Candidatus Acidiferrales bacterium]
MIFLSLINVLMQSMAALVIFVVGYLVLILCVIAGLAVADLIFKAVRLVWLRATEPGDSGDALAAKLSGAAHMVLCQAEIILNRVAPARRTGA